MKTRSLFLSHNRQWALFRGAVRGVLTKLLFQKTKRSAFKTWGQGKSLLLLHLEEPAISIQPAFLAYRLPLCLLYLFSFFFFFFFSLWKEVCCSGETPARRITIPRVLCVYLGAGFKKKKKKNLSKSGCISSSHSDTHTDNKRPSASIHLSHRHISKDN